MVIVPYDATKPIEGQKPDQFYLPYERFLELWQAAKEHREGPTPEEAAEAFVISAARYDGIVSERAVAFTGKLDVSTYNNPWVSVPLLFKDVKISALKLDGAPGFLRGYSRPDREAGTAHLGSGFRDSAAARPAVVRLERSARQRHAGLAHASRCASRPPRSLLAAGSSSGSKTAIISSPPPWARRSASAWICALPPRPE